MIAESAVVRSVTVCQCVILLENSAAQALPVSLMPCGDRPFLAWVMREMQRFGVEEFVLLTERCSQAVTSAIGELRSFLPKSARIVISHAPSRCGTGGALHHARQYLHERFLLCRGEALFSCNLARFLAAASTGHWLLLRPVEEAGQQAEICLQGVEGTIISLHRDSGRYEEAGLVSTGICLFEASVFEILTETCSLERDVLPILARSGVLRGLSLTGEFHDVGDVADPDVALEMAGRKLPRSLRRPAVFLDRDGVINRDFGWVGTRERFEWEPGVREAIARITDGGYHVFIVTNQSGIARGFYSEDDLLRLMDWVIDVIREEGGTVDDWRYCPMHPEAEIEQYRGVSEDRKPGPGMIVDLLKRWELDPARCVLFGDQPSDMQAAKAAEVEGVPIGPVSLFDFIVTENVLKI